MALVRDCGSDGRGCPQGFMPHPGRSKGGGVFGTKGDAMKTTITLALLLLASPVYAVPPAQGAPKAPVVKLSKSGNICHGVDSPWFARISNFKAFKTMADCLATPGTREPKNRKKAKGNSK